MIDDLSSDQILNIYRATLEEFHRTEQARWGRARFFLVLHVAATLATIGLLKMEGPWYVDAIVAAAFLVEAMAAVVTARSLRKDPGLSAAEARLNALELKLGLVSEVDSVSRVDNDRNSGYRSAVLVLGLLAILDFGACGMSVWLTFFGPQEIPADEESIALVLPARPQPSALC